MTVLLLQANWYMIWHISIYISVTNTPHWNHTNIVTLYRLVDWTCSRSTAYTTTRTDKRSRTQATTPGNNPTPHHRLQWQWCTSSSRCTTRSTLRRTNNRLSCSSSSRRSCTSSSTSTSRWWWPGRRFITRPLPTRSPARTCQQLAVVVATLMVRQCSSTPATPTLEQGWCRDAPSAHPFFFFVSQLRFFLWELERMSVYSQDGYSRWRFFPAISDQNDPFAAPLSILSMDNEFEKYAKLCERSAEIGLKGCVEQLFSSFDRTEDNIID